MDTEKNKKTDQSSWFLWSVFAYFDMSNLIVERDLPLPSRRCQMKREVFESMMDGCIKSLTVENFEAFFQLDSSLNQSNGHIFNQRVGLPITDL